MTLKEKLLQAGMQPEQIDNHCSDLYVLKNETSSKVLESYEFKQNITTFISQVPPKATWYEIPFAYEEYYMKGEKQ